MKKKIILRKRRDESGDNEDESIPNSIWDRSGESPNRIVMPRKIGKHRPEEERGYKPTVL